LRELHRRPGGGDHTVGFRRPGDLGDAYRNLIRLRGDPGAPDYFWILDSRNKESLAIDLKTAAGRAALDTLIERADVFITNYPFPIRERLRLRAEDVMPLNRRLIYASLTPYGEHGPERDRTAYDTTAWWARSGLMDMVRATGETEPGLSMPGMGDHPTAVSTYAAILTALYRRQLTGEGGVVSTSLLANGLWSNSCQIQAALCDIELIARPPRGERGSLTETYETADGRAFVLAIANPGREWPILARLLDREEWLDDPLFDTPMARFENAALLTAFLEDIFAAKPWTYWHARLSEANITFGVVARIDDHAADPQVIANDLLPEFVDGLGLRTVDSPFVVEGETKNGPFMAPGIGQHTRQILEEFGINEADIAILMEGQP